MIEVPAITLKAIGPAVRPRPLTTAEELAELYRIEINELRGDDRVARMKLGLEDAYEQGHHFKVFVLGHSGVGKTTELNRLALKVQERFRTIRLSAAKDLDSGSFQPFDVLLVLVMQLVEEAAKDVEAGGLGYHGSADLLQPLQVWFAETTIRQEKTREIEAKAEAGAAPPVNFFASLLGFFATLRGEIRFASSRTETQIEYRVKRLRELMDIINRVLKVYNDYLRKRTGQEWLFIGDDFEKGGVPPTVIERLFLDFGSIFNELEAHLIFTIPVELAYSQKATRLPLPQLVFPDSPVFDQEHRPHQKGREVLGSILDARVSAALFETGQRERLLVASGGNLRDLFSLTSSCSLSARLAGKDKIGASEVDRAISDLRTEYQRRLGESPYDPKEVTWPAKASRLVAIYNRDKDHDMVDPVLHSLFQARAVQEFNGKRWFGVHPLVVELLEGQGRIERKSVIKGKSGQV